ncbi:chitin synthase-domain-containing protein [Paraphysoderma sedebokerense]|nr:chitin synthase-domain-containing protein [Paraphysoderma sedebokerense]
MSPPEPSSEKPSRVSGTSAVSGTSVFASLEKSYAKDDFDISLCSRAIISINPLSTQAAKKPLLDVSAVLGYANSSSTANVQRPSWSASVNEIAVKAYLQLTREKADQCILFCGESGSGKTESLKTAIEQLVYLSSRIPSSTIETARLQRNILNAFSIIEAFGNASTSLNPNSSRFGNFIQLQYNKAGTLAGCRIVEYQLDCNRVTLNVKAGSDEQNFHIFYYMLAGLDDDEKESFGLTDDVISKLPYINFKGYDAESIQKFKFKFKQLRKMMKSVGLKRRFQTSLFKVLAALLHLSLLEFHRDAHKREDPAYIKNKNSLELIAMLLGVLPEKLSNVMTQKTDYLHGTICTNFLSPGEAEKARDELIRTIYVSVFGFLVEEINAKLGIENNEDNNYIGLVDLGGLENRNSNSLQQLCVNYGEERLLLHIRESLRQQFDDIQSQLAINTLGLPNVTSDVVDLLSKSPDNIFDLLNNASRAREIPSDIKTVDTLHAKFTGNSSAYTIPSQNSASGFGVKHYNSVVAYCIQSIVQQNQTGLSADAIRLFQQFSVKNEDKTKRTLMQRVFASKKIEATGFRRKKTAPFMSVAFTDEKLGSIDDMMPTVLSQYVKDLNSLFKHLTSNIWCVYCVKPNDTMEPGNFNSEKVKKVVTGLELESLRSIYEKVDYISKLSIFEFLVYYSNDQTQYMDPSAVRGRLIEVINGLGIQEGITVGRDTVYLTENGWKQLERKLRSLDAAATAVILNDFESFKDLEDRYAPESDDDVEVPTGKFKSIKEEFDPNSPSGKSDPSSKSETASVHSASDSTKSPQRNEGPTNRNQTLKKSSTSPPKPRVTACRRRWVFTTWFFTWWIPTPLLRLSGMKQPNIQMAWREKVALCTIFTLLSAVMLFFISFFGKVLCPVQLVMTTRELETRSIGKVDFRMAIHGDIYVFTNFEHTLVQGFNPQEYAKMGGKDASKFFPKWSPTTGEIPSACAAIKSGYDTISITASERDNSSCTPFPRSVAGFCHSYESFQRKVSTKQIPVTKFGTLVWAKGDIGTKNSREEAFVSFNGSVYDVTFVYDDSSPSSTIRLFPRDFTDVLRSHAGKDITELESLVKDYLPCLNEVAYVGRLDNRDTISCTIASNALTIVTTVMLSVMIVKFLAALQLGSKRIPENIDKYVIMQVPCYSENEESLKKTIDSLALLDYDDAKKLLFIVADGMIRGSGNEKSTPEILLDIFGISNSAFNCPSLSYWAIAEGSKQVNRAKVIAGFYQLNGRHVPYIIVIKVGKDGETSKPGNRGKRDSQMILMKFLNKVFYNTSMSPLELEIYHQIKHVIGVEPNLYEYCLMVDADTEVVADSLTRLVSSCLHDSRILGICGETKIANEKQSWVTMIQVYEYFISHHLSKAFESLFGTVTCLPGCFCMYRITSRIKTSSNDGKGKRVPLLIANEIIKEYSSNVVDTLHKKNLLSLGEDRYLTTLLLKYFPTYKTKFASDAHCLTIVPEKFSVLLSQRRRWTNSTIHNLFELLAVNELCGCLIFSMRFMVFLDLFATIVMPASVGYLVYLVYMIVQDPQENQMALIMLASIYGLQAVIFLLKRQWQHVGWMIIHILAMPAFYFYIPLYSFWHFDTFSWGDTRRIEGDNNAGHEDDEEQFDPSCIPHLSWDEFTKSGATFNLGASAYQTASPRSDTTVTDDDRAIMKTTSYNQATHIDRVSDRSQMSYQPTYDSNGSPPSVYSHFTPGYPYSNPMPAQQPVSALPLQSAYPPVSAIPMQHQQQNRVLSTVNPQFPYSPQIPAQNVHHPFQSRAPQSSVTSIHEMYLQQPISANGVSPSLHAFPHHLHHLREGQLAAHPENLMPRSSSAPKLAFHKSSSMGNFQTPSHMMPKSQSVECFINMASPGTNNIENHPPEVEHTNGDRYGPSDQEIENAVEVVLRNSDLNVITKRQVRHVLEKNFNFKFEGRRREKVGDIIERKLAKVMGGAQ